VSSFPFPATEHRIGHNFPFVALNQQHSSPRCQSTVNERDDNWIDDSPAYPKPTALVVAISPVQLLEPPTQPDNFQGLEEFGHTNYYN
jgi:hypothetical protein